MFLLVMAGPLSAAHAAAPHANVNSSRRALDASSTGSGPRACAVGLHSDCFDSGCCADPALACYKRPSKAAAQCLPRQARCVDTPDWLCPGWELCGKRLDECTLSQCCQSAEDECYQKDGSYAECRQIGACVGKKDPVTNVPWLCSVLHAPLSCSFDWQECTSSKCCVNPGFTCRDKLDGYSRCLRTCPDPADPEPYTCKMHDKAQIDTKQLQPHRFGSAHLSCSPNRSPCTQTACCENPEQTCYAKGPYFSMCLPTGTCREHWPSPESATCEERRPPDNCAAASQDCSEARCCAEAGYTCFQKDPISHEARCMRGCTAAGVGDGWQCNIIDKRLSPPPSPPRPPPQPLYRPTREITCMDFKMRESVGMRPCSDMSDTADADKEAVCNNRFRESNARPSKEGTHMLEPCIWAPWGGCAVGGPVECSPAQVTYVPVALPKDLAGVEDADEAVQAAAEAQGALFADKTLYTSSVHVDQGQVGVHAPPPPEPLGAGGEGVDDGGGGAVSGLMLFALLLAGLGGCYVLWRRGKRAKLIAMSSAGGASTGDRRVGGNASSKQRGASVGGVAPSLEGEVSNESDDASGARRADKNESEEEEQDDGARRSRGKTKKKGGGRYIKHTDDLEDMEI